MIVAQTFDFSDCDDELQTIASVIELLRTGNVHSALEVLVTRKDFLTRDPVLRDYDQRNA